MKRTSLLLSTMLIAQFLLAKDHVIVIKAGTPSNPQATEVKTDVEDGTETIMVTPASDATVVTATVKDLNGTIVSQNAVPASAIGAYTLSTPNLLSGTILEIRDDKGIVYTSYNL